MQEHTFLTVLHWDSQGRGGTVSYTSYPRDHLLGGIGKVIAIPASSAASFRGDRTKYNPEELLVASLSSCHMLSYLHLCADNGVIVTAYKDSASGTMMVDDSGAGQFIEVTLRPVVIVRSADMVPKAEKLHDRAHELCFIANSCNFPVKHEPKILVMGS